MGNITTARKVLQHCGRCNISSSLKPSNKSVSHSRRRWFIDSARCHQTWYDVNLWHEQSTYRRQATRITISRLASGCHSRKFSISFLKLHKLTRSCHECKRSWSREHISLLHSGIFAPLICVESSSMLMSWSAVIYMASSTCQLSSTLNLSCYRMSCSSVSWQARSTGSCGALNHSGNHPHAMFDLQSVSMTKVMISISTCLYASSIPFGSMNMCRDHLCLIQRASSCDMTSTLGSHQRWICRPTTLNVPFTSKISSALDIV